MENIGGRNEVKKEYKENTRGGKKKGEGGK
jgi:hypothetical protein